MMKTISLVSAALLALVILTTRTNADDTAAAETNSEQYTLRYKFHPGQTLRWKVVDRKKIETASSGSTQVTETVTSSVKVWRVKDVSPDGTATFENSVESVDMWQKLSGCQEVRYNSQTDEEPPPGFNQVVDSIGVPLSTITIAPTGKVLRRKRNPAVTSAENPGQVTIPLPEEPVAVGDTWSFPHRIDVALTGGMVKKVKTVQKFTLASVKTGVATIEVSTQILTPIHDPAIEAQLIQHYSSGTVRFDVDAGRVLAQQMDLDKRVVGFHTAASSLHYLTRFTEELLPDQPKTAHRPEPAGSKEL